MVGREGREKRDSLKNQWGWGPREYLLAHRLMHEGGVGAIEWDYGIQARELKWEGVVEGLESTAGRRY